MHVGQVFESIDNFKEALRIWAIVDHFEYRWPFSDSQRCKAICVHKDCDFAVRCNAYPAQGCAKVTIPSPAGASHFSALAFLAFPKTVELLHLTSYML